MGSRKLSTPSRACALAATGLHLLCGSKRFGRCGRWQLREGVKRMRYKPEELDALVAERVFGWRRVSYGFGWQQPGGKGTETAPPGYSRSITLAWEVVSATKGEFWWNISNDVRNPSREHFYRAQINRWSDDAVFIAESDNAPQAICLAVIEAVANGSQ